MLLLHTIDNQSRVAVKMYKSVNRCDFASKTHFRVTFVTHICQRRSFVLLYRRCHCTHLRERIVFARRRRTGRRWRQACWRRNGTSHRRCRSTFRCTTCARPTARRAGRRSWFAAQLGRRVFFNIQLRHNAYFSGRFLHQHPAVVERVVEQGDDLAGSYADGTVAARMRLSFGNKLKQCTNVATRSSTVCIGAACVRDDPK